MIEFVFGKRANPQAVDEIVGQLQGLDAEGTLYIGYPIFDFDEDSLLTDALLVTKSHGLLVFDLSTADKGPEEANQIIEYQDDLYRGLQRKFLSEKHLMKGRDLAFPIRIVSIRPTGRPIQEIEDTCQPDDIAAFVQQGDPLDEGLHKAIHATIQKTQVLKPQKRRKRVKENGSFGAVMKKIEKEISNLDQWQKKAAIESPEKPQRIRGLAGSGKTIILAMKAAYLHAIDPFLDICVTFHSRALYQQFEKLIGRFHFEHTKDDIDPESLHILHSWGSLSSPGAYSKMCAQAGVEPLSWNAARSKYGKQRAFAGACSELLKAIEDVEVTPLFDYVLVDEAQDLPAEFFQLLYKFTRGSKRIIWAYDEFQNLNDDNTMLPPEELFGSNSLGPRVSLVNEEGQPQQDILLPICYRNPPWVLTVALALGLGLYRKEGLVHMFPDPGMWNSIGYDVSSGQLQHGQGVSLVRSPSRTPEYFSDHMDSESAIIHGSFRDPTSQAVWVAEQIYKNLYEDELDIDDILIVFPSALSASSDSSFVVNELRKIGIDSHLVGSNSSQNEVFNGDSIAIAHIHRAKGNEAPMVYVMNAEYCASGYNLRKNRNTLFTAITRAKAWIRITGIGSQMEEISAEITRVINDSYRLEFQYPTLEEIEKLGALYGSSGKDEAVQKLETLKRKLASGEIDIKTISAQLNDLLG